MSSKIRSATERVIRSKAFLDTFCTLVAVELERQLRTESGGESIYISKTSCAAERQERDLLIWSCFTGNNIDYLSKRFGLTPQHIRRICKKMGQTAVKSNIGT